MRQPLSTLTRWVVASLLVGLQTSALAVTAGFLDINGSRQTIRVPGALWTKPSAIDNADHVVGSFQDPNGGFIRGFVYVGGTFTILDPFAAIETWPTDINDAGQVVGYTQEGYLLVPPRRAFLYVGGQF